MGLAISQGEEGWIPSACHEVLHVGYINFFRYYLLTFGCNFYKFWNKAGGSQINHSPVWGMRESWN